MKILQCPGERVYLQAKRKTILKRYRVEFMSDVCVSDVCVCGPPSGLFVIANKHVGDALFVSAPPKRFCTTVNHGSTSGWGGSVGGRAEKHRTGQAVLSGKGNTFIRPQGYTA